MNHSNAREDACAGSVKDEEEEELVVVQAHSVADPRAVVVELHYAAPGDGVVVCTGGLEAVGAARAAAGGDSVLLVGEGGGREGRAEPGEQHRFKVVGEGLRGRGDRSRVSEHRLEVGGEGKGEEEEVERADWCRVVVPEGRVERDLQVRKEGIEVHKVGDQDAEEPTEVSGQPALVRAVGAEGAVESNVGHCVGTGTL